jgi:hypothetical protein
MPLTQAKKVVNVLPVLEQVNVGSFTLTVIHNFYAEISDKDMHYTEIMPNESNECPQNNRFEVIYIKLIISYL